MAFTEESRERLLEFFRDQRFAVLATQSDGQPYLSLMAFAASDDLRCLVFVTERATRKFANLAANGRVAVLVDDRSNEAADLSNAVAVTAQGRAEELHDGARQEALKLFLRKHPHLGSFARSSACALVQVRVETYYVVSRFQEVEVLKP
jgi:nitroimidazol reductase NimA-like FMN-containing flavoprotein (pyridoxamine 5'-phosphate oxidase superfamily)